MDKSTLTTGALARRFFVIVALGGIGFFAVTCLADALIVYLAPRDLGRALSMSGWALLTLPVIILIASAVYLRRSVLWKRAALSIVSTFFACVVGFALALTLGWYFHFLIGGKL